MAEVAKASERVLCNSLRDSSLPRPFIPPVSIMMTSLKIALRSSLFGICCLMNVAKSSSAKLTPRRIVFVFLFPVAFLVFWLMLRFVFFSLERC